MIEKINEKILKKLEDIDRRLCWIEGFLTAKRRCIYFEEARINEKSPITENKKMGL